ncbi:MAG: DUF4179 domain-containing protein [Lachnospiraceae bacterium]|nr:DUF4179 domain-containing protein [Lachnospiraceae bacterium]
MGKYTEQELRETLGQEMQVSEKVDERLEQVYQQIRVGKVKQKRSHKMWYSAAGTTAAIFAAGVFCVSNPAMAAKIPVIGHIFEGMQDSFGYAGDYSKVGEPLMDDDVAAQLESASNAEEMEQLSAYTKTSDGLTVTLSEVYCNDQAIYMALQLKSEEAFPETYGFQCDTTETYSFNPTQQTDLPVIDGELLDEHTYAGMIRFDLNGKTTDMSEYEAAREKVLAAGEEWDDSWSVYDTNENWDKYVKTVEVPDEFTMDLEFGQIFGSLVNPEPRDYGKTAEELEAMSEEEWHDFMNQWDQEHPDWGWRNEHENVVFDGPWSFTVEVKKNTEDTQTVELNDVNEQDVGIEKVVRDRFEITVYDTYTDGAVSADYFPVILDADGRLMDYGGAGSVNTVAIGDRDVSHVDIFLVDYMKWMDELKGDYLREPDAKTEDGRTAKEMLLEESAYHAEVNFEK